MAKYRIVYDRANCTGVAACAIVAERFWQMDSEDKATLVGGELTGNDVWEREITGEELPENLEAARSCPVQVIKIIDEQNKEVAWSVLTKALTK